MKHAYLILAHDKCEVLARLIFALDDERNDIYIHFDKNFCGSCTLETGYANLYIVNNRVKVSWGDVSVIEAEYQLFEAALNNGPYAYYHLLSGVDMPIKSQDYIHSFFDHHQGKEFIGFSQVDESKAIDRKVRRYHIFPRSFRAKGQMLDVSRDAIRATCLKLQFALGIKRNLLLDYKKGTQWASLTHDFVKYVVAKKSEVIQTYQYTFCSDEIFVQTLCWHSSFSKNVFDPQDEGRGCMREIGWKNNELVEWETQDFDRLINSEALFARKFNSNNLEVVDRILYRIVANV